MQDMPAPAFIPVGIAVWVVSDSRTEKTDRAGKLLAGRINQAGHRLIALDIVRDDLDAITAHLRGWIADPSIAVILTTGGTGVTGRDVTPEALHRLCQKEIPGFGELFRLLSFQKIGTSTIQSRACAGVAGTTFLFALPGSVGACRDGWDDILVHQLDSRHRPCNFVTLMPRLNEE